MPYPRDDAKLKKWTEGMQASVAAIPDAWNRYDVVLQSTVMVYATHLRGATGYLAPDWQKIKAIAWTETGAWIADWDFAPMQIGVNNDPGLRELLTTPQGRLILPPEYQQTLNTANVPSNGEYNIKAGIGYLHKILARFGQIADVTAAAPPLPSVPNKSGVLQPAHSHHPHHHHHTHVKPKEHLGILGWRTFDFGFIAEHYNVGDGNYFGKLSFAYSLIQDLAKASTSGQKP